MLITKPHMLFTHAGDFKRMLTNTRTNTKEDRNFQHEQDDYFHFLAVEPLAPYEANTNISYNLGQVCLAHFKKSIFNHVLKINLNLKRNLVF